MKRALLILAASAAACLGGIAQAQSADGGATLSIQRSLSVATVRPMRIDVVSGEVGLSVSTENLADAPAMIQITGDPGRVYRIRVPRSLDDQDLSVIEDLTIWSSNTGDITVSRVSHLDPYGRDMLRVMGRLRLRPGQSTEEVASLPLSIDYE
ncbi:hypothetical protein GCM10009422_15260 [Brevundimonas kwangchunensis]|uniref:Uncharacterized protein n=1 Tax=Brevundimonas kwangchunensis TaxID=322163 RepID=A0ABN1GVH5_9CAUL